VNSVECRVSSVEREVLEKIDINTAVLYSTTGRQTGIGPCSNLVAKKKRFQFSPVTVTVTIMLRSLLGGATVAGDRHGTTQNNVAAEAATLSAPSQSPRRRNVLFPRNNDNNDTVVSHSPKYAAYARSNADADAIAQTEEESEMDEDELAGSLLVQFPTYGTHSQALGNNSSTQWQEKTADWLLGGTSSIPTPKQQLQRQQQQQQQMSGNGGTNGSNNNSNSNSNNIRQELFYSDDDYKRFRANEERRYQKMIAKKLQKMVREKLQPTINEAVAHGATLEDVEAMMPRTHEEMMAILNDGTSNNNNNGESSLSNALPPAAFAAAFAAAFGHEGFGASKSTSKSTSTLKSTSKATSTSTSTLTTGTTTPRTIRTTQCSFTAIRIAENENGSGDGNTDDGLSSQSVLAATAAAAEQVAREEEGGEGEPSE